jgi:tetratricopeptide (TPR) repeat protein/DNA-binding Xre family transcriptional regulator
MAPRGKRSLKASPKGINRAEAALVRLAQSKTFLADKLQISRASVQKFFTGEGVGYGNFRKICEVLNLPWQEIAEFPIVETTEVNSDNSTPIAQVSSSNTDSSFVGRESAIAQLYTLISQGAKVILIHAKGGVGKTTLARKYLQQQFGSYIEFPIAKETQNITSVESLIEERLKQLGEEPGREFGVSLDRLKRKLETERIGVLIDNLEPALDGNGKIIEPHRRYVELLRVLANPEVHSVTLITSRECLRESAVTVGHYLLEGLDVAAWQEFFNSRQIQALAPLSLDGRGVGGEGESSALSAMHKAYGGNAKAMEILSSAILQDYDGNSEAYWQANQGDLLIEKDLEDLVTCQFNRLQQLNPDAYKLLCRMGCYRYQDVPTVPEEGLFCLLWGVPEAQHRRVVKSLRDRSLVEFKNGEYWLHPVIRAEAIARLRASEDWETANCKAADFWNSSIKTITTPQEGLKKLEAYYQYKNIEAWEDAAKSFIEYDIFVLNKTYIPLPAKLRSFGYIQTSIIIIKLLLTKNNITDFSRCFLYIHLGDFCALNGRLREAIFNYETSLEFKSILNTDNTSYKLLYCVDVRGSLAFIYMRLGEYIKAINLFNDIIPFAEAIGTLGIQFLSYIYSCLSLMYQYIGEHKKSLYYLNNTLETKRYLDNSDRTWIKSYGIYNLGKSLINYDEFTEAEIIFNELNKYSQTTFFKIFEGLSLSGLAEVYRGKRKFERALSYHSEAIELLEKIDAKCDLAEAYYQHGLTYQKMEKAPKSQENFDKAIQLFSEMEAPKQVEKVRQVMELGG